MLHNFANELTVAAIVPYYDGATASLEERHTTAARFDTVDELIEWGEFDGAVVALPNDIGPGVATQLAKAGKHLLVEKPGAGSADDLRELVAAVEETGVAFQAGYMWRYDEAAERLQRMYADERFGKPMSIEARFTTSDVNRRGPGHYLFDRQISTGGFFNWLACHCLDLVPFISGQSIAAVTARVGVFGTADVSVEDGGVAIMELADGSLATFVGGYWIPRWAGAHAWTFRGSERWVEWDPGRAATGGALDIHGPMPQWNAMEEVFTLPVDTTPGYGGIRGLRTVQDWLGAIRSGGRPCRNTPRTMLATLELIDAIYESSRSGRRIECSLGSDAS